MKPSHVVALGYLFSSCHALAALPLKDFPEGRLFYTQQERERRGAELIDDPSTPPSPFRGEVKRGAQRRAYWEGEHWIYPKLPTEGSWKIQPLPR